MIAATIEITEDEVYNITLEHVCAVHNAPKNDSPNGRKGLTVALTGGHKIFLTDWDVKKWNGMVESMMKQMLILKPNGR